VVTAPLACLSGVFESKGTSPCQFSAFFLDAPVVVNMNFFSPTYAHALTCACARRARARPSAHAGAGVGGGGGGRGEAHRPALPVCIYMNTTAANQVRPAVVKQVLVILASTMRLRPSLTSPPRTQLQLPVLGMQELRTCIADARRHASPWSKDYCMVARGLKGRRALVLLLAGAPAEAGAVLAPEVYSGHVDMYQRLLVRTITALPLPGTVKRAQ